MAKIQIKYEKLSGYVMDLQTFDKVLYLIYEKRNNYLPHFLMKNKNSLYIHIRTYNEFLVIYIGSFDTPPFG